MSENVTKGADEKFCSSCGAIIKIAAEICPKCGVRQMAATSSGDPNASEKSRTTTLILCIFLGVLGIHRIYIGKKGIGIAQVCISFLCLLELVSCLVAGHVPPKTSIVISLIFSGFGIWAFIDFILILTGNFKDKEGKRVLDW